MARGRPDGGGRGGTAVAAGVLPLDRLVGAAVEDQLLVVVPLVAFLRGTARARSAGLADVILVGAAAGVGHQAVQAAVARAAGDDPGGWACGRCCPAGSPMAAAPGPGSPCRPAWSPRRRRSPALRHPGVAWAPARPVPLLVLVLVVVDRVVWEARAALPGWLLRVHDVLGGGGLAGPLLVGLMIGAVLVDHRDLARRRDRLPRLPGERGDLGDVPRAVVAAARAARPPWPSWAACCACAGGWVTPRPRRAPAATRPRTTCPRRWRRPGGAWRPP